MKDPRLIHYFDSYKIPLYTDSTTVVIDAAAINRAGIVIYDWAEQFRTPCNSNGELVFIVDGLGATSKYTARIVRDGLVGIGLKEKLDYVFVDNPRKFETQKYRPYRQKEQLVEVAGIPWLNGEIDECGRAAVWKVKKESQ